MKRIGVAVVVVIGVGLSVAQSAAAATYHVTCATLQNYLNGTNAVNNGDTVELTGICPSTFSITNTNAFTLVGVGRVHGVPQSGFDSTSGQMLNSNSPVRLTIRNLLFKNGNAGLSGGSAIYFWDPGSGSGLEGPAPKIVADVFTTNQDPQGYGGAVEIASDATKPTVLSGNVFHGNTGEDGGALYFFSSSGTSLQLLKNTFTANSEVGHPGYYGGAVDIEEFGGTAFSGGPVRISGNTFGGKSAVDANTAYTSGGALFLSLQGGEGGSGQKAQTVTLTANTFRENEVTGNQPNDHLGGAVALDLEVRQFPFRVVQSRNLFASNGVSGNAGGHMAGGGAEWSTGVSIRSTADSFIGNEVAATNVSPAPEGGALGILGFNQNIGGSSSTTAISPTFTGADDLFTLNSIPEADAWGGAIYTGGAAGNDCNDATCPPSHLKLSDSTLTRNVVNSTSGSGAAIWGGSHDSLAIENSIVFGNTGPSGAAEIFGYFKPSYSYDDACKSPSSTKPLAGAGNICANPELASTGQETAASPTIDRGSNSLVPPGLTKDLAGRPRITEGRATTCKAIVDMGAFESRAVLCHH